MPVSALHQHEAATGIHVSRPSRISHPSSRYRAWFEFPASYCKLPLALPFTHGNVCFPSTLSTVPPSPRVPATPTPPHAVSTSLFSMDRHVLIRSQRHALRLPQEINLPTAQTWPPLPPASSSQRGILSCVRLGFRSLLRVSNTQQVSTPYTAWDRKHLQRLINHSAVVPVF